MYHHLETTKKQFIGKTLESIAEISPSPNFDDAVLIEFGDGTKLKLSVDGDCCSHSMFYEIVMPDELKGAILEDIIEGSGYNDGRLSETTADSQEVALSKSKCKAKGMFLNEVYEEYELSVWNIVLKTNRGLALIRHLNISNGYYDGETYYETV
jgi:hypothetical protein